LLVCCEVVDAEVLEREVVHARRIALGFHAVDELALVVDVQVLDDDVAEVP